MNKTLIKKIAVAAAACTLFVTGTAFANPNQVQVNAATVTYARQECGWRWKFHEWVKIGDQYYRGKHYDYCKRTVDCYQNGEYQYSYTEYKAIYANDN